MKTFKQVVEFNQAAGRFLQGDPKNIQTKLGYAIDNIAKGQVTKIIQDFQKVYRDLFSKMVWEKQVDLALTDKATGAILTSPAGSERPFLFDKEGLKKTVENEKLFEQEWIEKEKEYNLKEFDINPHFVSEIPEDLSEEIKKAFEGFVIEPVEVSKNSIES